MRTNDNFFRHKHGKDLVKKMVMGFKIKKYFRANRNSVTFVEFRSYFSYFMYDRTKYTANVKHEEYSLSFEDASVNGSSLLQQLNRFYREMCRYRYMYNVPAEISQSHFSLLVFSIHVFNLASFHDMCFASFLSPLSFAVCRQKNNSSTNISLL